MENIECSKAVHILALLNRQGYFTTIKNMISKFILQLCEYIFQYLDGDEVASLSDLYVLKAR